MECAAASDEVRQLAQEEGAKQVPSEDQSQEVT